MKKFCINTKPIRTKDLKETEFAFSYQEKKNILEILKYFLHLCIVKKIINMHPKYTHRQKFSALGYISHTVAGHVLLQNS